MSTPLDAIFWLAVFGLVVSLVAFLATQSKGGREWIKKRTGKENLFSPWWRLFWPCIHDSSVIVFHYITVVGYVFIATEVTLGSIELRLPVLLSPSPTTIGYTLLDSDVNEQSKDPPQYTAVPSKGSIVLHSEADHSVRLDQWTVLKGLLVLIIGLTAAGGLTNLLLVIRAKELSDPPIKIGKVIEKGNELHDYFRSVGVRLEEVLDYEARALWKAKACMEEMLPGRKGLNLIISIDSRIPDPAPLPVATLYFALLQAEWAEGFKTTDKDCDFTVEQTSQGCTVRLGNKRPHIFYPELTAHNSAQTLDCLLIEALRSCLVKLIANHKVLTNIAADVQVIPFPRAIRLLFGSPRSLVHLAEDYHKLPKQGFPSLGNGKVLNIWMNRDLAPHLFSIATTPSRQPCFDPVNNEWYVKMYQMLEQLELSGVKDEDVFVHTTKFCKDSTIWQDRDCLAIGTKLFQAGYGQGGLAGKDKALLRFLDMLPLLMASLHCKKVVSFYDYIGYASKQIGAAADRPGKHNQLTKDLENFCA